MSVPVAEAFCFCPRCGAQRESPGGNPFSCVQCGFTHYFGPVTAVGGIVCDGDGDVLFLQRKKDPGKGKLGIPGGFVDAGETVEEALRREAIEELNLHVVRTEYLVSFPNEYIFQGVALPVTDVFFECEVDSFDDMRAQEAEVDGWHFCHPDESTLDEMAFPSNRKAVEEFLRRRRG